MTPQKINERVSQTKTDLVTQDNRCTADPMFCLQVLIRDMPYDPSYFDTLCWHDGANETTIYDDDPDFPGEPEGEQWDKFGYKDRWETVMVAFTEAGLLEYMELDGHNVKRLAFRGQTRIYVESFRRCPEMIAIREDLMATQTIDSKFSEDGQAFLQSFYNAHKAQTTGEKSLAIKRYLLKKEEVIIHSHPCDGEQTPESDLLALEYFALVEFGFPE
jgi:hypothetical protein